MFSSNSAWSLKKKKMLIILQFAGVRSGRAARASSQLTPVASHNEEHLIIGDSDVHAKEMSHVML